MKRIAWICLLILAIALPVKAQPIPPDLASDTAPVINVTEDSGLLEPDTTTMVLTPKEEPEVEAFSIGDFIKSIPGVNQVAVYSFESKAFKYANTLTLYKDDNGLRAGVGVVFSSVLMGYAAYGPLTIEQLRDKPILKLIDIEPMIYAGYGRIEPTEPAGRFDWGIGTKLFSVEW